MILTHVSRIWQKNVQKNEIRALFGAGTSLLEWKSDLFEGSGKSMTNDWDINQKIIKHRDEIFQNSKKICEFPGRCFFLKKVIIAGGFARNQGSASRNSVKNQRKNNEHRVRKSVEKTREKS